MIVAKIEPDVLKQIVARKQALEEFAIKSLGYYPLVHQMAQRENSIYLNEEFNKLGLDITKNYQINDETGEVVEVDGKKG